MHNLIIISFLIFYFYINFILYKFNSIPRSLSNTYYMLGEGGKGYLFTIAMFGIGFTIIMPMLEITPENLQFLAFICPAAICFVGASPNFIDKMEGKIHDISAYICAITALLWVILVTDYWYLILVAAIICLIFALLTKTLKSSIVWWSEMVVFVSMYAAII